MIAILGGPILFAYAIGWALLPNRNGMIYAEEAFHKRFEPAMIAIGALILFTIVPAFRGFWWEGPPTIWGMPDWLVTTFSVGWALLLVAAIVWVVIFLLRRTPASSVGYGRTAPAPRAPTPAPATTATADAATQRVQVPDF